MLGVASLLDTSAYADPITLSPDDTYPLLVATGDEQNVPDMLAAIADLGIDLGEVQYVTEADGGEEGAFEDSYTTDYDPDTNPTGATITYVGDGDHYISGEYLLVQDGNQTPAWYLFDLTQTSWTGTEAITLDGFWEGTQGSISNIRIFGTAVPDGGLTLTLLGLALAGLGVMRQRFGV